jgi:hypothetical protein
VKACYLIEALEAMREADDINYSMDSRRLATILNRIAHARIDLKVHSGILDTDIEIEMTMHKPEPESAL